MDGSTELIEVGEYNLKFNEILGIQIKKLPIFRSKGLATHMIKRSHFQCLKHIDDLPDIIADPDYIVVD